MAEVKYIIFKLGEQKYGMKLSGIKGIEHVFNVVPVPLGAPCIKGIIQLRNVVIPVYNLKERFMIDTEAAVVNKQLLVSEVQGMLIAFEVDDVLGIVPVPESEIHEIPNVVAVEETKCFENVVNAKLPEEPKAGIVLSISVDNIMSESDISVVSDALSKMEDSKEA